MAAGWIPVGLVQPKSVKHAAFLVVVLFLVPFAGCSTVPTGLASENTARTWQVKVLSQAWKLRHFVQGWEQLTQDSWLMNTF